MNSSEIKFNTKNYLPLPNSASWVKSGGSYLDDSGRLVIPPGASAYCDVSGLCDQQFNYFKLNTVAICSSFDPESSLDSDALVSLVLNYTNTDNKIYSQVHGMGLATTNLVSENKYKDSKILDTLNILVYKATISIENLMKSNLIIEEIKLFISDDISSSQTTKILNDSLANKAAARFDFGTDADRTKFIELMVTTAGNSVVKFKPVYDGEWPVGIDISGVGTVPCGWYVVDDT